MRTSIVALALALATSAYAAPSETQTLTGSLTADNAFFAFISTDNSVLGTQIGSGNDWGSTFNLTPTDLKPGTYYLQIEAINYGGPGAIIGSFSFGSTAFVTNATNWQASFNNDNSDPSQIQPWVTPTGGVVISGANGDGPWGFRDGISANASWIDGSVNGLSESNGGNATVDFSTRFTVSSAPEPSTWAMMGLGFASLGFAGYRGKRRSARALVA